MNFRVDLDARLLQGNAFSDTTLSLRIQSNGDRLLL